MMSSFTFSTACNVYMTFIQIGFSASIAKQNLGRWYCGRIPPSSFEYSGINGFHSPTRAQMICENDVQCGGFTFKGTKRATDIIPEVYFFHFINETSSHLKPEIEYPHWTSYIVGSRDHIMISGSYSSNDSANNWRRLNGYANFLSEWSISLKFLFILIERNCFEILQYFPTLLE